MKLGIIGIGEIARKAYLPIFSTIAGVDLYLSSRNMQVLEDVGRQYRITHQYQDWNDLLDARLDAVLIHAATLAHETLVLPFLQRKIPVFIDKPITNDYYSSAKLFEQSQKSQCPLVVGFNRRFAPVYKNLKSISGKDIVIMQKNRENSLRDIRTVIFDDFIHVVDTLRFLIPGQVEDISVQAKSNNGQLEYVVLQWIQGLTTAIGIMHLRSGYSEELVEILARGEKWVVKQMSETIHLQKVAMIQPSSDWTLTLEKRGFTKMVLSFLEIVRNYQNQPEETMRYVLALTQDALFSHKVCEKVVHEIESMHNPIS